MDIIYDLLSMLPFDWLSYGFMKNALLAVLLITPLFGLLSTMVLDFVFCSFCSANYLDKK